MGASRCTRRIKFYANAIVELHEFGHETGLDEEPWGLAYQRKAVKVYLGVLGLPLALRR